MIVLTQKSIHLALHGLNHIHTSYSYHISFTFDLHNCISTKNAPKHYYLLWFTLTLSQKRVKNPKMGSKPIKRERAKIHRRIPWVTTLGHKKLGPCYKYIMKGSPKTPFFSFLGFWTLFWERVRVRQSK